MTQADNIIPWHDLRIDEIWSDLGGPAIRWHGADRGRARAWWRQGTGHSVSLYRTRNLWHDFATNAGGRCLELVQVATGVDRRAAVAWLAERYGAPGNFTDDDRREQAARARGAELAATWRRARIRDLEQTKAAAAECLGLPGDEDERAAAWVHFISTSRELHAVEHLEGDLLRIALNAELRTRTAETAAIIYEQREWEAGAVELADMVITAIASRQEVTRHVAQLTQ